MKNLILVLVLTCVVMAQPYDRVQNFDPEEDLHPFGKAVYATYFDLRPLGDSVYGMWLHEVELCFIDPFNYDSWCKLYVVDDDGFGPPTKSEANIVWESDLIFLTEEGIIHYITGGVEIGGETAPISEFWFIIEVDGEGVGEIQLANNYDMNPQPGTGDRHEYVLAWESGNPYAWSNWSKNIYGGAAQCMHVALEGYVMGTGNSLSPVTWARIKSSW